MPATYFVSESPEGRQPFCKHGAFQDDSALGRVGIRARPHGLDDKTPLGYADLQGSVVKINGRSTLLTSLDCLVMRPFSCTKPDPPEPRGIHSKSMLGEAVASESTTVATGRLCIPLLLTTASWLEIVADTTGEHRR